MRFARIIGLVLASLFIGVSALNAQVSVSSQPERTDSDGDGSADVRDERPQEGSRPAGQGQTGNTGQGTTETKVVHTLALDLDDLDEKKVYFALPLEVADAYAIMVAGEQGVKFLVPVVAGHLELDLDVFRRLSELSVREARIWVGTATQIFFIDVRIDANIVTLSYLKGGDGGVVILPEP